MTAYRAYVVDQTAEGFQAGVRELCVEELMPGEVLIKVAYSSVNYKDGLAARPDGRIVKTYPFIPGIDLAGAVVDSQDPRYISGEKVIVTSYGLGVSHFGGFSEYARVPADWVVRLPDSLTMKEAMALGTAGLTAALSVQRLEEHGLKPGRGSILVTGATGGVGSLAVAMLAKRGYEVVASTGKEQEHEFLTRLGAAQVIPRLEPPVDGIPTLGKQVWAGAIDPVGGPSLAYLLSMIRYGGSVAVSGLTGGGELPSSVYPFILRGVNLLGVESVYLPMREREQLWRRMATDLKPIRLIEDIADEIGWDQLPDRLAAIYEGRQRGRAVLNVN